MRKKRKMLNLLMVLSIAVIFLSGIMIVGNLKGWFEKESVTLVTVDEKEGGANIERSEVAYALEEGAQLRDGDIIQTLNGAAVEVTFGKNRTSINENSEAIFRISEEGEISITLKSGEFFFVADEPAKLYVNDAEILTETAVFAVSAQYGSSMISVLANELTISGETVKAGQQVSVLEDGIHQKKLSLQTFNDFNLQKIRETLSDYTLCFDETEIDALEDEREQASKEALEAKLLEEKETTETETQKEKNKESMQETEEVADTTNKEAADKEEQRNEESGKATKDKATTDKETSDNSPNSEEAKGTCTITIRCDTILNNMDALESGKNKYVPANGVILATSKVSFHEGDSVFDVLKKACSLAGIQLEYAWTPMYNSYYVEGINHLYEFDCGEQSGWMYKVNGWFPNYGCSSYKVENGDTIVWCYTCKGLGADVGGSNR